MPELFPGQHTDERVLVVTRPHWLRIAGQTVVAASLVLPLVVFYAMLLAFLPQALEDPYKYVVSLAATVYLYFIWVFFFLNWMNYWLDMWIVTDERVLKVEQRGLFSREFNEFKLSRVQDVVVDIKGFVPTLFKFGDLVVQTAGDNPGFTFKSIPDPEKIKDIILYYQDRSVKRPPSEASPNLRPPSPQGL